MITENTCTASLGQIKAIGYYRITKAGYFWLNGKRLGKVKDYDPDEKVHTVILKQGGEMKIYNPKYIIF